MIPNIPNNEYNDCNILRLASHKSAVSIAELKAFSTI